MVRNRRVMREMLFAVFILSLIRSAGSKKMDECPAKQEMSCESLRTTEGYTYPVLLNIPGSRDCEHAWYLLNGTCIAHSDGNGKNLEFVVAVTLENLTVSACEDLQWELRCDSIQFHCTVNYTVIEPEEKQDDNNKAGLPDWGTALIVIGIMIVGALIAAWLYVKLHWKKVWCS
ncbi:uncharacterized protein LOC125242810 isoform X2 [Megalobrama amblycephala]|uniref:uncharacterized protein LOC125242810 isoform X2 n=1 Tax=Megalobrama amblycephala TaxID=75352 RepID=UPI0020144D13|nr:uncharacterized protein LOC125242810 isoform X2 [Megalobrama amblycephala]